MRFPCVSRPLLTTSIPPPGQKQNPSCSNPPLTLLICPLTDMLMSCQVMSSPLCSILSYSSLRKAKASYGFTMHNITFAISLSVFPSSRHMPIPLQHHQPPQTHRHAPALGLCVFSSLFRILCLAWLLVCLLSSYLVFFRFLLKGHLSNSPLGISVEHLVAFFTWSSPPYSCSLFFSPACKPFLT